MKRGDVITVTSREQLLELYGWAWPQSAFEPCGVDVFEVEMMTDELKLFGKLMEKKTCIGYGDTWSMKIGDNHYVDIFSHDGKWICHVIVETSISSETPEFARDDAEATLRKLRDALTEVIGDG